MNCPQPFTDCRSGACNCDGVRDRARLDGEDPVAAVRWYLKGVDDAQQEETLLEAFVGLFARAVAKQITALQDDEALS